MVVTVLFACGFAAIPVLVFIVAPAFFAVSALWDAKVSAWRDRKIREVQRPSEARELAEAKAEIQRLRTELAERGMR